MTGLNAGSIDNVVMGVSQEILEANKTYKKFTLSCTDCNVTCSLYEYDHDAYNAIELIRWVDPEEVEHMDSDVMPGFRISWWYTGTEVTPERLYSDDEITKQFVR